MAAAALSISNPLRVAPTFSLLLAGLARALALALALTLACCVLRAGCWRTRCRLAATPHQHHRPHQGPRAAARAAQQQQQQHPLHVGPPGRKRNETVRRLRKRSTALEADASSRQQTPAVAPLRPSPTAVARGEGEPLVALCLALQAQTACSMACSMGGEHKTADLPASRERMPPSQACPARPIRPRRRCPARSASRRASTTPPPRPSTCRAAPLAVGACTVVSFGCVAVSTRPRPRRLRLLSLVLVLDAGGRAPSSHGRRCTAGCEGANGAALAHQLMLDSMEHGRGWQVVKRRRPPAGGML